MRKKLAILRIILYIIGLIILYSIPLSYIEGRSFCIFYNLLEKECIGCGTTRAFFNMIHFNFITAFNYNKLAFIWIAAFFVILVNDIITSLKVIFKNENCNYSYLEKVFNYLIKVYHK